MRPTPPAEERVAVYQNDGMPTVLGWNLSQWACVKFDYDHAHPISVPPSLHGMQLIKEWHHACSVDELIKRAGTVGPSANDAAYQWAAKAIANAIEGESPAPDKDPRQLELNFEGE